MRELKFRVWDKIHDKYREPMVYDILNEKIVVRFPIETLKKGEFLLEQYAGLKDKNGKEIYEGNIVRWSFKVDRNSELTYAANAVKWETYAEEEWPYSTISGFTLPESEDGYEVIGNIHENPELLEEE